MASKKNQADCRANNRGGRWAGIPICVISSPSYRGLSLWARAILTEIVARMNGYNNGSIAMSLTEICSALGNSNRRKASLAIAELMQHGFVDVTTEGDRKERLAREYRLTFVNTVSNGKFVAATEDYRNWTPPKQKSGGNASLPVKGQTGNASSPERECAGNASSPDKFAKLRKTAPFVKKPHSVAGNDASLLISKPYPPCAETAFQTGWWQHSQMDMALSRLVYCIVIGQMAPAKIRRVA